MRKSFKKIYGFLSQTIALLLIGTAAMSQTVVTGKVTDVKDNSAVSGVNVTAKGSKVAVQTDAAGVFKINVPANSTALVFSSAGFSRQEVALNGRTAVDVQLAQNNQQLNEVVIVGYGAQKKKEVTGTIAKIGADKIANVPSPSFESALAGKAAGVNINTSGGAAGSGAVIRIRGIATLTQSGDPLIVIDGIPVENNYLNGPTRNQLGQDRNPLANIDPNEIESVEILKDAAAAGIFGSRGANGVIIITTKRGKGNKLKVNFGTRFGIATYSVKPSFVDKNTWLALRQEAWEMDGNTGVQQNLPGVPGGFPLNQALNGPATDWWDLATRTGGNQSINLSVAKAGRYINYFIGGSFSNENSYIVGNDYKRYGLRGNFDIKPIEKLSIGVNASYNTGISNLLNNAWNGGLGLAMSTGLPFYPVYNTDGSFFRANTNVTWDAGGGNNFEAQRRYSDYRTNEQRLTGGINATYTLFKDLNVKGYFNYNQSNSLFGGFRAFLLTNPNSTRADSGDAFNNFSKYTSNQIGVQVDYRWKISQKATLVMMGGVEQTEDKTMFQNYGGVSNAAYFNGGKNDIYAAEKARNPLQVGFNKIRQSIFTRFNFNYLSRYFIQATVRRDGSSVFAQKKNKWGYFPTVSGSWAISEEGFMQKQKLFNFLKLRVGWGLVGNDNVDWTAGYATADTSRGTGGSGYGGSPTTDGRLNLGNNNLKWETTNELTAAIEFGILKNRISGEVAVYKRTTQFNNLLTSVAINAYNGINGNQTQNLGDLFNQGLEVTLNTVNVRTKNFSWTSNLNIAYNYNEVTSIGSVLPDAIAGGTNETRVLPGQPIGTIFTVRYVGVDPADGLPIFLDRNGNRTKTLNVAAGIGDKVPVANVYPLYTGGITNTFRYKNFELNTLFTYQIGGHIWDNSGKRSLGFMTDWNVYSFYVGNYWRKPGDVAKYPRPTIAGYPGVEANPWSNNSSLQVFESDFIRLRELTLAYNFPEKMIRRWKMTNARFFVSGYNLLLFTKYPVGDPETGRDGEGNDARNQSANSNFLNAPLSKSINFGLNVSF
jgi:TonB-dependent starch-binding outer membrane protein SusC